MKKDYSKYKFARIYDDKHIVLYKKMPRKSSYFSLNTYSNVDITFLEDASLVITADEINFVYNERVNPRQLIAKEKYHPSEITLGTRRKYIFFGKKLPFYRFTNDDNYKRTNDLGKYYLHTNRYKITIGVEKK